MNDKPFVLHPSPQVDRVARDRAKRLAYGVLYGKRVRRVVARGRSCMSDQPANR
jgi:hypothetical protein